MRVQHSSFIDDRLDSVQLSMPRISSGLLAGCLAVILPVSTVFWLISFLTHADVANAPSPFRWLFSFSFPIVIAFHGVRRKSLDWTGVVTGVIVGFILCLSNFCFVASLLVFFWSSSKATTFRSEKKQAIEDDYKTGGQRNWMHVLSNGGVAMEMALLYMIESGIGEHPIDFSHDYNASWFALAVLCSLSCGNGDTWASEIGAVTSRKDPVLITTFKRVPVGTNGGVTAIGIIVSALGGMVVGVAYYLMLIFILSRDIVEHSPPQWPIILVATIAGFYGSVIDSILGATLQYSGVNKTTGKVVEHPGPGIIHISGYGILDNHSVNLLSNLICTISVPPLGVLIWSWLT